MTNHLPLELKIIAKHLVTTGYTGDPNQDPMLYLHRTVYQRNQELSKIHPSAPRALHEIDEATWKVDVHTIGWDRNSGSVAEIVNRCGLDKSAIGSLLEYYNLSALYKEFLREEANKKSRPIS